MLSKDEILSRTNKGLDVFRYYLPGNWRVERNFLNPLYNDRRASCNVYFDKRNNSYRLKDFGNEAYSGDCFALVGKLHGLECQNPKSFVEILQIINRDLSLHLADAPNTNKQLPIYKTINVNDSISTLESPKSKAYIITTQAFTPEELAFWLQYSITNEILKTYKTVSLKEFKSENSEGKPFNFKSSNQEPMFGYIGKRNIKIYSPFSEIRFLYGGNSGENYCFGLEQLPAKGDILFITGGEKDVLSLASHGFAAICFNSETSHIPAGIIRKLSNRFKHIVLLYDVDKTGLESSLKHQKELKEFGVKRLLLPLSGEKKEKDISDFFRLGNASQVLRQLFHALLEQLYEESLSLLKPCEIDFNNPPIKSNQI